MDARPRRVRFGTHGGAQEALVAEIATEDDVEVPPEALMNCIERVAFEKFPHMRGQMLGSSLVATAVVLEEFVTHYLQPLWRRQRAPPEISKSPPRERLLRAQRLQRARRYRPVIQGKALRARVQRLMDRNEAREDWFSVLMRRGPVAKEAGAEDASWINAQVVKEVAQRSLMRAHARRQAEIQALREHSGLPPLRSPPASK